MGDSRWRMVSDSSLTMDDVIMISLLFLILSDTLQFEFFASREKSQNWILPIHSSNYVIVSTHHALLFEIKSTLCGGPLMSGLNNHQHHLNLLSMMILIIGLLVLRPSISSLLQSATSIITKCERYCKVRHYNCIVPSNVRWSILYVWRMSTCKHGV